VAAYGYDGFVPITWYVTSSSPYYIPEAITRRAFYGTETGVPNAWFDGVDKSQALERMGSADA
jgi:hypothetical protein